LGLIILTTAGRISSNNPKDNVITLHRFERLPDSLSFLPGKSAITYIAAKHPDGHEKNNEKENE